MKLTKILENTINRQMILVEAIKEIDKDTWVSRFDPSTLVYGEGQYAKFQSGIGDALRNYIGDDVYDTIFGTMEDKNLKSINIPPAKLKILRMFNTCTSIPALVKVIETNKNDDLFQALFEISSVTGSELEGAVTSGRGGLGKGEVLCVLLAKNGVSGGTDSADLVGDGITAEVKSTKTSTPKFAVPLTAARIKPWITQKYLRVLYSLIDPVIDLPGYQDFLKSVNDLVQNKMKQVDNDKYFFKSSEPIGNLSGKELANLKLFFHGCYLKYYGNKAGVEDDIYLDIDSPDDDKKDLFLKAKLLDPAELSTIKKGNKVSFSVTSANKENARLMEVFENRLKQHPFVKTPNAFADTMEKDLKELLKVPFLIFQETGGSALNAPIVVSSNNMQGAHVTEFSLNQVKISVGDIGKEQE
jgi:hypothetical protein